MSREWIAYEYPRDDHEKEQERDFLLDHFDEVRLVHLHAEGEDQWDFECRSPKQGTMQEMFALLQERHPFGVGWHNPGSMGKARVVKWFTETEEEK